MLQQLDKIEQAVTNIRLSMFVPNKTHILIHHSAGTDHPTFDWGQIRRDHMARGFVTVGYQYGVERVGDTYEIILGRFEHQAGAHCPQGGMNRLAIGICCIGNFELVQPPQEQWDLCRELVRHLMRRLSIPRGNVLGHKEVPGTATLCPGKFWDMAKFRMEL
jgi:N-acetylmuramoyl-L-alanine amidase